VGQAVRAGPPNAIVRLQHEIANGMPAGGEPMDVPPERLPLTLESRSQSESLKVGNARTVPEAVDPASSRDVDE
jgi:hypothetical protein